MKRIKKLKPVPVILGVIIVFLAMLSLRVESQVLRFQISDVAVFLTVLFFYALRGEDLETLERKVEEIEEKV
ncbi:hypothetical protein AKJ36_00235 [candidate division MSBL1 archaeon SCGC-AAA259I07]|uniref:Uncharacterized protein n=1 Tax=candidate division MSBL1 archaeon SCGC-AAA259I07 TaxID=1698266 RepID=A0A133UN06_9EURY|nr:hypothetical protein AKJ36_00235 [candidate division MSBL1 archaeon SCGC-AAA259I07]